MEEIKKANQEIAEKPKFLDRVRSSTPEIVTDNAPRIVSALKMCANISMLFSKNKAFAIAGAGFIAANSISLLFGKKKTEEEKEKIRQEQNFEPQDKPKGKISKHIHKVLHPNKYPLESAASIATVFCGFWTASGVLAKDGFSPGRLIAGLLNFFAAANIAFTRERIGEPEANLHSKGSIDHYVTEMKNRPVLLSSMLNITSDIASIIGGAHEARRGKEAIPLLNGLLLLSANVFQAIFVNKNDYNIEKKAGNKSESKNEEFQLNNKSLTGKALKNTWRERIKNNELDYMATSARYH
jgi:hypothetical protein